MRRACQRVVQTRCAHSGSAFHAGRAIFAVLQPRDFSTSTERRKEESNGIRWFQQTGKGQNTIKALKDDELDDDLENIDADEQELAELDKSLAELGLSSDGPGVRGTKAGKGRNRQGLQTLGRDEVVDLHSLDIHYEMPLLVKRNIGRFNNALQRAATEPQNLQARRELWSTYIRCAGNMPGFLNQITDQAWKVLWRSQSAEPFFNEQAGHLLKLADDMHTVGIPLTPGQKLTRIKAYEADGQQDKALTQWHLARKELDADGNLRYDFAALGVTLECAAGHAQQALHIAFAMIKSQRKNIGATRLLIPVISAFAKQGSDQSIKQAWLLYLLVRKMLGRAETHKHAIDAEDFDQIYLGFVEAGRRDLAVLVFKDLIVAGQQSEHDSLRIYRSYYGVLDELHSEADVPAKVNQISLEILSVLPKKFENKFFYASWMKRLIGMGRVDVAASVLELMFERAVNPDARHVNGIIGAWLRGGVADDQTKALDLAWAMVDNRIQSLARRHRTDADTQAQIDSSKAIRIPAHLRRQVPAANTETLCLLLLYYTQKNVHAEVERVTNLLSTTELRPNSYFMNHLMYYYCRQGKSTETWDLYNKLSPHVRPDVTTFACLWDCSHALTRRYEQLDKFPSPRRLFSTMMNWFSQLSPRDRSSAQDDFKMELYTRIAEAFMQFKDIKGMLVSLYAMRDSFMQYPNDDTIRAATMQVAQIGESRQAGHPLGRSRTRRRKASAIDVRRNIEKAGKVLEMIVENRTAELTQQGVKIEDLEADQRGEESLYLLAELLRTAIRRSVEMDAESDSVALSEEIDKVAWEIGAGPFRMGAPVYNR